MIIGQSGTIGRQALAERAGLGGGSVRTVVKKLREEGLVRVIAAGCSLTGKGRAEYRRLASRVTATVDVEGSQLALGKFQSAIGVRGASARVNHGIEQRDSAVRVGASGAITYVFRDSKFTVPNGSKDCERDFPGAIWKRLREELHPRNDDVVIVSGAGDEIAAGLGAVSAALTLA